MRLVLQFDAIINCWVNDTPTFEQQWPALNFTVVPWQNKSLRTHQTLATLRPDSFLRHWLKSWFVFLSSANSSYFRRLTNHICRWIVLAPESATKRMKRRTRKLLCVTLKQQLLGQFLLESGLASEPRSKRQIASFTTGTMCLRSTTDLS